jgi:phosphatidylglycerophosphatase A
VKDAAEAIATCFGIGRVPLAPGTAASLAALPLGWGLVFLGPRALALAVLASAITGIWACTAYANRIAVKDPSECVIDEVAGQWIALFPIAIEYAASEWRPFAMAFFLFRLFDITKPWPLRELEKLNGGLGIMADDIAAGFYAGLALYGMMAIQLI